MKSFKFHFCPVYVFVMSISFFASTSALAFHVNPQQVTVSGLSSGAYMAEQLQVAFSDVFSGLGIFAGGTYNCAQGNLTQALQGCSSAQYAPPALTGILSETRQFEKQGLISSTQLLQKNRFYFYRGKKDPVISQAAAKQASSFFETLGVPAAQMLFVDSLEAGHGMPTVDFGNSCDTGDQSPFINNCNYDGAGEMLKQLYGPLQPKTVAIAKNIFSLPQKFIPSKDLESISLASKAYAYVPTSCQQGKTCRLHVALHGCRQTTDEIQNQFYTKAGYNEWAEANDIIVLYPQAIQNAFLNNPKGCWDWWGYTGAEYATRNGPQLQVILNLIKTLSSDSFSHSRYTE